LIRRRFHLAGGSGVSFYAQKPLRFGVQETKTKQMDWKDLITRLLDHIRWTIEFTDGPVRDHDHMAKLLTGKLNHYRRGLGLKRVRVVHIGEGRFNVEGFGS
jgi:hypothetical protein